MMIKAKEVENTGWNLVMIQMNLRGVIIERGWNSGKIKDETIETKNFDEAPE